MLLIMGTINMALVGFNQVTADGAAFVAAHVTAQNAPSPSAAATGIAVAQQVFPRVQATNIAVSISGGFASAQVTLKSMSIPGQWVFNGPFNNFGVAVEPALNATPPTTMVTFSVPQSTLANYLSMSGVANPSYSVYLAQKLALSKDLKQIDFSEWQCHDDAIKKVNYQIDGGNPPLIDKPEGDPGNAREKEKSKLSDWDPTNTKSWNYTIYQWDAAPHTCSDG